MSRPKIPPASLPSALLGIGIAIGVAPAEQTRSIVFEWLGKLDATGYSSTWATASEVFKVTITSNAWAHAAQLTREPLGKLQTRTEKSADFTQTLPGAPDGEYVVFQFDSVFEKAAQSLETVTTRRDPDGAWRVAGYFIK